MRYIPTHPFLPPTLGHLCVYPPSSLRLLLSLASLRHLCSLFSPWLSTTIITTHPPSFLVSVRLDDTWLSIILLLHNLFCFAPIESHPSISALRPARSSFFSFLFQLCSLVTHSLSAGTYASDRHQSTRPTLPGLHFQPVSPAQISRIATTKSPYTPSASCRRLVVSHRFFLSSPILSRPPALANA